jgi:hypothetical protein
VINSCRIIVGATIERQEGAYVMGFADQRDSGLDEIDYVSAWILRLAIGMIVLGALFAVFDRYHLLPAVAVAGTA